MAFKRLPMRKIHHVLRLFFEAGLSIRAIARSLQASPSTVRPRANDAGYQEEVASMQAGKTSSTGVGRMPRSSRVNACRPTTLSRDISFT